MQCLPDTIKVAHPCDLCDGIAGQRRFVELDECRRIGCDGVHIACNACIRARGVDPATCPTV